MRRKSPATRSLHILYRSWRCSPSSYGSCRSTLEFDLMHSGIHSAQIIVLLLMLFVAGFTALARKLQTPYPIVLVIAGLVLSLLPGIPRVTLDSDLIFLVVLPPLLFSAAWLTSWRDFVHNLVGISSLAFGLVGFTVLGVAGAAHVAFPGFDWRLGVVL